MPTKRSVIDDALRSTGNNLSVDADQTAALAAQSLEWSTASGYYDRELPILLQRHDWPFAMATEALEQADDDDNPSNRYDYAYEWPYDALWLKKVEAPGGLPLDYEILGRFICMDYDGTEATSDQPVATYILTPEPSDTSDLFWEILRQKIEVGLLRFPNEDLTEARARARYIEDELLPLLRNRTDQQTPARKAFRSTMRERRRSGGGPSPL